MTSAAADVISVPSVNQGHNDNLQQLDIHREFNKYVRCVSHPHTNHLLIIEILSTTAISSVTELGSLFFSRCFIVPVAAFINYFEIMRYKVI